MRRRIGRNRKRKTNSGQSTTKGPALQRGLGDAIEGIVGRLLETLGSSKMEWGPVGVVSFVIISVMKTLLRGSWIKSKRRDVGGRIGHGW